MSEPKLSAIISAHNCEDYIGECLECLFNQTRPADEIIVVLDASTDRTPEVVESWKDRLPLLVLRNKERMGKPWSLNRALDAASGEFVAQVDADDISHPEKFEVQIRFMKSHPKIDVCGTCGHRFGAVSEPLKRPRHNFQIRWWLLLGESPMLHTSVIYRVASLNSKNLRYNPVFQFCQDYELFARMASKGLRFANLPYDMIGWRAHNDNTVQQKNAEKIAEYRDRILHDTLSRAGIKTSSDEIEVHRWLSAMRISDPSHDNRQRLKAWSKKLAASSFSESRLCPSLWALGNIFVRSVVTFYTR